jgi:AcrR family transcriptional regulator
MPRSKNRNPLTREQIINRAIQILDAEGEAGLSMRQLAADFSVDPMALYYHIPNKASLIQEAINAMLLECEIPESNQDWQSQLRQLCRSMRVMAQKHPKIYVIYAGSKEPVIGDFVLVEAFLSILQAAKLTPQATGHALMTLFTYVSGFALEEATGRRPYSNHIDIDEVARLTVDRFPITHQFLNYATEVDMDEEFEFGVDLLITGIARVSDQG